MESRISRASPSATIGFEPLREMHRYSPPLSAKFGGFSALLAFRQVASDNDIPASPEVKVATYTTTMDPLVRAAGLEPA